MTLNTNVINVTRNLVQQQVSIIMSIHSINKGSIPAHCVIIKQHDYTILHNTRNLSMEVSSRDLCDLFIRVLCLWGDLSSIQINIFWFQCDECGYQLYILSTLKRHISEVNDSWWEEWKKKKLFATNVTQFLTDKY